MLDRAPAICAQFNASGERGTTVTAPYDFHTNVQGSFSVWVKLMAGVTVDAKFALLSSRLDLNFQANTNKVYCWFQSASNGSGQLVGTSAASFLDGNWHNVVISKGATLIQLYIDGTAVGAGLSTTDVTNALSAFQIGDAGGAAQTNYRMRDAMFWSVALTSGEVTTLYGGGTPQAAALVGVYHFTEGGGLLVHDNGTNGYNMTLTSGVDFIGDSPAILIPSRSASGARTSTLLRRRADTGAFPLSPVPRGIAIAGAEFGSPATQSSYTYFKGKGFNTARIPFKWEDVQFLLNGSLNTTVLDTQIGYATTAGIKVILDMHNFGRRKVYLDGGFTDDFDNTDGQTTFQVPYGDQNAGAGTFTFRDYGRGQAGTLTNPVSPATSYIFSLTINAASQQTISDVVEISVFRVDDNNQYRFVWNPNSGNWTLNSTVLGTNTVLKFGTKTFTLGVDYDIVIDVGQTTANKINVSIDGVALYTADSQATVGAHTGGYVMIAPTGLHVVTSDVTLDVAGDTTSGNTTLHSVGDGTLTTAHFADFWSKMATKYGGNSTVYGFDLMNEPFSMTVPTDSSNYATTASTTLMYQAAIDAVRLINSTKWLFVETDEFAGAQTFVANYGSNPTPWYTDPANRLVYTFHYYFNDNHDGTYPDAFKTSNLTAVAPDCTPIMQWAYNHHLNACLGEFGVPNTSDWMPCLTAVLDLCNQYLVWTNHWAGGDAYNSPTTIQPTFGPTVDKLQMSVVGASQYLGTLI